jgi:O-acetylserine/cysteine efflux transporter
MSAAALPPRHLLLALAAVLVWGSNFVVIQFALAELPPLTMAALRFTMAALPAALLLPRPAVPWGQLAAYGLFVGAGQFALLYTAMAQDISPGMASLVIQTQVFFTLLLAVVFAGERVQRFQGVALALAAGGIGVILLHTGGSVTPLGLLLTLAAAFSWACGNLVGKRAGRVNMLAYTVWSSFFAAAALWALVAWHDGLANGLGAIRAASPKAWLAMGWQAYANTLFGYGVWSWLLSRHEASRVVPFALGVPVVGMVVASVVVAEPLPGWKLAAAGLVLAGLALNVFWPALRRRLREGA